MSRVVVVKSAGSTEVSQLSRERYRMMLEAGFVRLAGDGDVGDAVAALIPKGRIGFKTNCLPPKLTCTPVNLSYALTDLLVAHGHKENNLVIWERTNRELERARYELNASSFGVRCMGTDTNQVGYDWEHQNFGDVNSCITTIMTELLDYNINLPVLKDHSIAGLSGNLKNMYGAIHNPNKYHDNNCDPFAAQVSMLEPIRSRNILSVIDAVNVQYNGGPGLNEHYLVYYGGLIIATDPVAADRIGLEIVEHLRGINGQPTLARAGRPVKYLATAERIGLGIADLNRIKLEVIELDSEGNASPGELF